MNRALCQVCGESVENDRVCCARCHAPHHKDCWEFNAGCSIFACGGKDARPPTTASEPAGEVVFIGEQHGSESDPAPPRVAGPWLRAILDPRVICAGLTTAIFVARALVEPSPTFQLARVRAVRPSYRSATARPTPYLLPDLAPIGIAQIVEAQPELELPRGELVYLLGKSPVISAQPGFNIHITHYLAVTEAGRLVSTLRSSAFEIVAGPQDSRNASVAVRALREAAVAKRPGFVILVDPASQGSVLAPGTIVRVERVESGPDGPITYAGRANVGAVRVPAASCRPVLAATLAKEALEQL
ncbi:MAG: hypothetical protein HY303_15165 [Candidatus Wallbacteria bacterium]|nr:hypothetical protein [Candidatus Wallbacteria bacterium]